MDGEWLFYCTINLSRLIGILGDSPTQTPLYRAKSG